MKRALLVAVSLLALGSSGPAGRGADKPSDRPEPSASAPRDPAVEALRLVPFPKEVRLGGGRFDLRQRLEIELSTAVTDLEPLGVAELELNRTGAAKVQPSRLPTEQWVVRFAAKAGTPLPAAEFRSGATAEDYRLTISTEAITVTGKGPPGLAYGLHTLAQLIRANSKDGALPTLEIRDWPSLRWRAFQDDLTRGPSSTLEELKRGLVLGAWFRLNVFTYYMEYQYAFAKHPDIPPPDGALRPQELEALVAFGKPRQVEILGNQQSFGHFAHILKHPAYEALRETPDILSPVNEASYRLLDDLYSEVVPLVPFPFFNVCCDETFGLGTGPSKELAGRIGVGGVYAGHLRRLHDLLKDKYGKRMMMWGDIILNHPEHLKEIPTDTILLTWGYHPGENFEDQITPFARSGYEFFVCPGVNNWSRILPDFGAAVTNIRNFVRDGVKHGALGMLNTAWDDDGETLNAPNWHGIAWGAECAWNASQTPYEAFNRRLGAVLFGEPDDHFGQAIDLLAQTHRLPGMEGMLDGRFWASDLGPVSGTLDARRKAAERLLALVRPALVHLERCQRDARANAPLLDAFLFGARRMELIGQRALDRLEVATLYRDATERSLAEAGPLLERAQAILERNRDTYDALARRFTELWQRENRPYALDWTLARYRAAARQYDEAAQRLARIRRDAAAGQPLPSPQEAGIGILELGARKIQADRLVPTPLDPDAPWAEPEATHRLGLEVGAGKLDRFDLPVEILLRLPPGLEGKGVRAVRLDASTSSAVVAQLDPAQPPTHTRLTLLLPEALPKGATARLHLYLGLPASPPAPATAVSTRDADQDMKWIENDRVRLLLGPEGAHLYRWEVKAVGNRDLTMPGETGWAGFADIGGARRSARYDLACTARGPAVVRYVCTDPEGFVKTLSLFAGMSWVEVTLSEPVSYYWDFDDPKNFAADGPTPGRYQFSDGSNGAVGREADGVPAQVRAGHTTWGVKFVPGALALGLVTPETDGVRVVAPGAGAGGVGVEGGPGVTHVVTYAGRLEGEPAVVMERLRQTLDFREPPLVAVHAVQAR